jgi:hypothetical protein
MRISHSTAWLLLAVLTPLQAQDADEVSFEIEDEAPRAWQPLGELLLRGDRVTGLPGGREDLERIDARARAGLRWQGTSRFSAGFAIEAAIGSDANDDNLINNDIEKSDDVGIDQAWLQFGLGERAAITLGKTPMPLTLSPLLWDDDLRPLGLGARASGAIGEFDRWQLDAGLFEPDPLDRREARVAAVQLGWHWREGAPTSAGVLLGYLDFDDTDALARFGLGRGNSLVAGRYRYDYRLLDAQFYLRRQLGERRLEARLDLVRNLDAETDDRGTRASLVLGDRFQPRSWEFGWSWQRIERDSVFAAVNSDDWWFHTAARGHMPWIGYGVGPTWSVRLAAFFETRDGLDERTERLLLDLEARW